MSIQWSDYTTLKNGFEVFPTLDFLSKILKNITNILEPHLCFLCVFSLFKLLCIIFHWLNDIIFIRKIFLFSQFVMFLKDIPSSNSVLQVQKKSSWRESQNQSPMMHHPPLSLRTPNCQEATHQTSITLAQSVARCLTDHQSWRGINLYTQGSLRLFIRVSSMTRLSRNKRSWSDTRIATEELTSTLVLTVGKFSTDPQS